MPAAIRPAALLDMPMEKVLESVPLTSDMLDALLHRWGPLGEALVAAIACEHSNAEVLKDSPIGLDQAQESYLESLNWAFQVQDELAGYSCVSG